MSKPNRKPDGHQFALEVIHGGEEEAREVVRSAQEQLNFDCFINVYDEDPRPAYLHSALCAMSLPVTIKGIDQFAPIVQQDGKFAMAINPRPVLQEIDGKKEMKSLGIPYGSYPRIALIYIMSQATKYGKRDVYLGQNFTDWMRRLGYNTVSYGPRGTATQMKHQLDRLLACDWHFRWDDDVEENAFAVRDVKISNEYAGASSGKGWFSREIRLSETFFEQLIEHAVPMNEHAIAQIKGSPTALDLYSYLAYRLPRITTEKQVISWHQLGAHLGNVSDMKRLKRTVRDTMHLVSSVYPNANIDLSESDRVTLYPSPRPDEKKFVGRHLGLAKFSPRLPKAVGKTDDVRPQKQLELEGGEVKLPFPSGSLSFGKREAEFRQVGLAKGGGWSVDKMAEAFRAGCPDFNKDRTDAEWMRMWEKFVTSYRDKRKKG